MFKIIPNEQTPKVERIDDVSQFINDKKEILAQYYNFVNTLDNAAGLAANQVSYIDERLMFNIAAIKNFKNNIWLLILNPQIDEYIGAPQKKLEGCLTWHDKTIVADRYNKIIVSFYDINGKHHEKVTFEGFYAQVLQHEIDHLNGVNEQVEPFGYKLPKAPVIGRNDLCICGSGLKYKKCCLTKP